MVCSDIVFCSLLTFKVFVIDHVAALVWIISLFCILSCLNILHLCFAKYKCYKIVYQGYAANIGVNLWYSFLLYINKYRLHINLSQKHSLQTVTRKVFLIILDEKSESFSCCIHNRFYLQLDLKYWRHTNVAREYCKLV